MKTVVECVANFSEGRDVAVLQQIASAVYSVSGVVVLDVHLDADHNRSVVTFAGEKEAIGEAALRAIGRAAELIDLSQHSGKHPRIGAADVVPFVPLRNVTLADCVAIARHVGRETFHRFRIPVYLYEAAATRPERVRLENIRRGQFEILKQELPWNPERRPDFGEARVHPTAGATAVGARNLLVAYNINLNTADVQVARVIARAVRESSGGLPYVKALGIELTGRKQAQVSMNLTAYEKTSMRQVFERVNEEARKYGVEIASSQVIGLIPRKALEGTSAAELRIENFTPQLILETRLEQVIGGPQPPLQS